MKNYKLKTMAGDDISTVAKKAKEIAKQQNTTVEFDFNEIKCLVSEKTVVDWLVRDYMNAHIMEWKTVGDDCKMMYDSDTEIELRKRQLARAEKWKQQEVEQRAKDKSEREETEKKVQGIEIELTDKKAWDEGRAKNTDGYGNAVYEYALIWARLMQKEIANGKTVAAIADESQQGLGYLGITGFQYGCAVNILSHVWKYGEELRKWHNKKYGVSEEKKGVVNPAILTIG